MKSQTTVMKQCQKKLQLRAFKPNISPGIIVRTEFILLFEVIPVDAYACSSGSDQTLFVTVWCMKQSISVPWDAIFAKKLCFTNSKGSVNQFQMGVSLGKGKSSPNKIYPCWKMCCIMQRCVRRHNFSIVTIPSKYCMFLKRMLV